MKLTCLICFKEYDYDSPLPLKEGVDPKFGVCPQCLAAMNQHPTEMKDFDG